MSPPAHSAEHRRLEQAARHAAPWKKWGPYLSERQWGTVREDEPGSGDAWESFPHDHARSRAYRYGEDGLAGLSDDRQRLCFALALWNGKDPFLKERLFGLSNSQGNHGEDVKEYYFYLDATPTHSYLKYLYKYPQSAFPYDDLVLINRQRSRHELEYELLDTGIFDEDRYFDVFVEYAKASPEDLLIEIRAENRGPDPAEIFLLPTLWFRNTWHQGQAPHPALYSAPRTSQGTMIAAFESELGHYFLYCDRSLPVLFTENETNHARISGGVNSTPFVKDGINDAVVSGRTDTINPDCTGTKAAFCLREQVPSGGSVTLRLRLCPFEDQQLFDSLFDQLFELRRREAREFWDALLPASLDADARTVAQQALAGLIWSKQYYEFDLATWLAERGVDPTRGLYKPGVRNSGWYHMRNRDVVSVPDKWEYPWYAAWDLAFHAVPLSIVDLDFAKEQLDLMLVERYMHPNGQLPAYEWNFSHVNPPVHAWAAYWVYTQEKLTRGSGDYEFLCRVFRRLLVNFTWWVNRKDPDGRNVFSGGFLGLDDIGLFDRSQPIPGGGQLEQADGTAWMAFYCLSMLQIATELAMEQPGMQVDITKFVEHFLWIASAMDRIGEHCDEMWDEEDGFFYDVLRFPSGHAERLRVRSIVGLLPLCAVAVLPERVLEHFSDPVDRVHEFLRQHPHLKANIAPLSRKGVAGRRLFSLLDEKKLRRVLAHMLDESEFLSPHGIRAVSRVHLTHPYGIWVGGEQYTIRYEPAESTGALFGGNANWRGPVWFPINALIIRALILLYTYYGNDFRVECPTGSGRQMNLMQIAQEIVRRLSSLFLRGPNGERPVFGAAKKFQHDPHWRDYLLFYEYFHGDNGAGIGASHQTGWTSLVGALMCGFAEVKPDQVLELGGAAFVRSSERAA